MVALCAVSAFPITSMRNFSMGEPMTSFRWIVFAAAVAIGLPSPGRGQEAAQRTPQALQSVLDCRAIVDDPARLACFDASVAKFDSARSSGEIVTVDREAVRETRKGLFGFSLPDLGIFGDHDAGDEEEISQIDGTIASASRNGEGYWVVRLEDGAVWEQTESRRLGRFPKPGMSITIKQAALGSYKMSFGGGPSMRARRTE